MRVKMTFSYDGTDFFGSQIQRDGKKTVLGEICKVLDILHIETNVTASGRTDRGVHATAQVCHFDLPKYWEDIHKLHTVLNTMLPKTIHIKSIQPVHEKFHARYDAKRRIYRYILKEGDPNPFESRFVTFEKSIDLQQISQNITLFQGTHNFEYFAKTGSDTKNFTRHIYKTFAYKYKEYIILHFEANGFLRAQIRLMVGALLDLEKEAIRQMLEKEYKHKLRPAPPNGLYLAKIKYEENIC